MSILENVKNSNWDYDEDADILYLSLVEPQPALGMDIGDGLVVQYKEATREVVGLKIIGVRERIVRSMQ